MLICFWNGIIIYTLCQNLKLDMHIKITYANSNLDILKLITSTSEPRTKLITRKLLIFKYYQVDPKVISVLFIGGETWSHVFYYWFFDLPNPKDCWVINWDWKDSFFNKNTYKLEKYRF